MNGLPPALMRRPDTRPAEFRLFDLPTYRTAREALADYAGDDHIYVIYPRKIDAAAQTFVSGFPGTVLYAVKANPHPAVLQTLWDQGVRNFDVASLREVELVNETLPGAQMYLMHPVKSRTLITRAYALGIRHFAFDCAEELQKIIECTQNARDLNLHIRLALPRNDTAMPLVGKFGADFCVATDLLQAARPVAAKLGLCFHVGSQCLVTDNYDEAISYARSIVDAAGVAIDSIDVGGGFPVAYPDMPIRPMEDYFHAIKTSLSRNGFDGITVLGEPGRALCAEGGSTLARIELRKGNDLYLNDGVYGSLFDAGQFAWQYPLVLHSKRVSSGATLETSDFRVFGPTCDSLDMIAVPLHLPSDAAEGDWIEIRHLGAYGQSLASRFNGFHSETTIAVLECCEEMLT